METVPRVNQNQADEELRRQARVLTDLTFDLLRCCEAKEKVFCKMNRIRVSEFRCLRIMEPGEHYNLQDLATGLNLSPSRLTRIVDGLFFRGLVQRRQSAEDRRYVDVELTDAGLKMKERLISLYEDLHQQILAPYSPSERETIFKGVSLMHKAIKEWLAITPE